VGGALSTESHEFFQLYVYAVSVVRFVGPGAVLTVYTDDERPGKTTGARHDMEKSVHGPGLGVFSYGVGWVFVKFVKIIERIFTKVVIVFGDV
jgi:hypothetical protein